MPGILDSLITIPPGWEATLPYPSNSGIVSVAANSGQGTTPLVQVVSFTIPNGTRLLVSHLSCRMVDGVGDADTTFIVRHNGLTIQGFDNIVASIFTYTKELLVGKDFAPGLLEIMAANVNANVAYRVQAYWFGWMLSRIRQGRKGGE